MTQPAISVSEVTKRYSSRFGRSVVTALDGVSLRVEPGEIFGLLGPNGAGKTTAVKILLGLTHATSGEASISRNPGGPPGEPAARRISARRPSLSRLPDGSGDALGLRTHVGDVRPTARRERIPALLERVRLSEWADVRVKKFSKGMVQRLGLAAALVARSGRAAPRRADRRRRSGRTPRDPRSPAEEARRGRAILLNSHLLSEIEQTCSRVAILRKGRVVREGRIEDLTRQEARYRMVAQPVDERLLEAFRATGAAVERVNGHLDPFRAGPRARERPRGPPPRAGRVARRALAGPLDARGRVRRSRSGRAAGRGKGELT